MAQPDWGVIKSGSTFEALVSMLVFYEDPKARLFGRPGKDGGQDVRSGDGLMVYQAKFHDDQKTSHAFSDARSELNKIREYRTSSHPRYEQWRNITHWRLVTDVNFNTTDEQRWTDEIVPIFAQEGLTADYWTLPYLDGLLAKHPEIQRMFFDGETRVFLTPFEAEERLRKEAPFAPQEGLPLPPFVGRKEDFERIRIFLQTDTLFLAIHGPGGVGKSRLLVEVGQNIAGDGEWQVLWGLPNSMEHSSAWFRGIVPERPTLLLLDEPENERLLRLLGEQLGNQLGRTIRWKAVMTVRSGKDPVLHHLRQLSKFNTAQLIELHPLKGEDPEIMCRARLSQGRLANEPEEWRKQAAQQLARLYRGYPVWLNLAISVLERDGDLNRIVIEEEKLAERYLEEILGPNGTPDYSTTLMLLRWIALIGPVNREDNEVLANLAKQTGNTSSLKVQEVIKRLVDRRALSPYGVKDRLVTIRPDSIRDHLLLRWLVTELGFGRQPFQPSDDAQKLIQELVGAIREGIIDRHQRRILVSLARTEWLLQKGDKPLSLLDQFFADLLPAIPDMSAGQRTTMVKVLGDIADTRPIDVINIVQFLREHPANTEEIANLLGDRRTLGQSDVLLELPWLLYLAAQGSLNDACDRKRLLSEMCKLMLEETRIGLRSNWPRDGRRASALLSRIHGGGPDFMVSYDEEILPLSLQWFQDWLEDPSAERSEVLTALIGPTIALEREQIFSEGNTVTFRRIVMLEGDPGWQPRMVLLQRIRNQLQDDSLPVAQRCVLWKLLDDAHRNLSHATRTVGTELLPRFKEEILNNLRWTLTCLQGRKNPELMELQAAREIWDWHLRFDVDVEGLSLAEQLEGIYQGNQLAAEFEPLVSYDFDNPDNQEEMQRQKAEHLAELPRGEDIVRFVERAAQFHGGQVIHPLLGVATHLGQLAPGKPVIGEYLEKVFSGFDDICQLDFATLVISFWVTTLRQQGKTKEATTKVRESFIQCSKSEAQILMLQRTYSKRGIEWAPGEYQWLLSQSQLYQHAGRLRDWFCIIAQHLDADAGKFKNACESVLQALPYKDQPQAVTGLIEGIYLAVSDHRYRLNPDLFPELGVWLLDQVALVYDLREVHALRDYGDMLFKRLGRAPITWLAETLVKRMKREYAAQGKERFYAISMSDRARLSRFVEPIHAENCGDKEVVQSIERLVDFSLAEGSFRYGLHEYLKDIDPGGLIVPKIVASRLKDLPRDQEVQDKASSFARIALEYSLGGVAWRQIASAVLTLTNGLASSGRERLWEALVIPMMRTWSTTLGQVPQVFIDEAHNAQRLRDSETEDLFRPFWNWYVEYSQSNLSDEEERIKESLNE
ncbi:MAG: ATP-binding protein [Desulfobulbaceae bacterium]|nr:ATP-binding protein [Desulfobulbaceae bacterium]